MSIRKNIVAAFGTLMMIWSVGASANVAQDNAEAFVYSQFDQYDEDCTLYFPESITECVETNLLALRSNAEDQGAQWWAYTSNEGWDDPANCAWYMYTCPTIQYQSDFYQWQIVTINFILYG